MQQTATKTETLFAQGYRIRAGREALTLIIRKPDGTRYTLQPARNCCSCPAGQRGIPCKHLRHLDELVREQWAEINDSPAHEDQMYALMLRWEEIQAAAKSAARR